MSADGEVQVQVKAEGVDEASEELAGEGGGVGGAEGGEEGPGGLRGSLRAGLLAGLLAAVSGPLLDVVSALLDVLNAFLAPVAALLLRLAQPLFRVLLTELLPKWIAWLDISEQALGRIRTVLEAISAVFSGGALSSLESELAMAIYEAAAGVAENVMSLRQRLGDGVTSLLTTITSLPGRIWNAFTELPSLIGEALASRLPNVDSVGDQIDRGEDAIDRARDRVERGADRVSGATVNIQGGLGAFVDRVESDSGVDLP